MDSIELYKDGIQSGLKPLQLYLSAFFFKNNQQKALQEVAKQLKTCNVYSTGMGNFNSLLYAFHSQCKTYVRLDLLMNSKEWPQAVQNIKNL